MTCQQTKVGDFRQNYLCDFHLWRPPQPLSTLLLTPSHFPIRFEPGSCFAAKRRPNNLASPPNFIVIIDEGKLHQPHQQQARDEPEGVQGALRSTGGDQAIHLQVQHFLT